MSEIRHAAPAGFMISKGQGAGRRGATRHRQHGLICNLGEVQDLSIGGMRMRMRREPQAILDVVLTDYTRAGELRGRVVWVKPCGHFHYEIGLAFEGLHRSLRDRLGAIALAHRFRRAS